ncbi:protein EGG APPARATUS-1 [Brachypodium distachyon]|uniref:Uncharacterized protein n=1 Tax=Brachypodium distachyon TaxID=15368 RepID=A0A0Q3JTF1_BRADI|nr:protein EGG APPARATUS-1 [Brachypodium distachyon]KQK15332.1 hypothetical protein BRADI_1g21971v3 [Brachypodium distachyon]|eukprot:XP_003559984.1 protein EGG APPARATUS-1 [Brachypodium distachyon]
MEGLKQKAKQAREMLTTPEGAVATAAFVVGAAVGAYFLWPAAAVAAGATMKAPGAAGYVISRAAFLSNPQLYFQILRTAGAAAAPAVFAPGGAAKMAAAAAAFGL